MRSRPSGAPAASDPFFRLFLQYHSMIEVNVAEGALTHARTVRLPHTVDHLLRGEWKEAENPACLGMITLIYSGEEARWARGLPFPVVNVSNAAGPWRGIANFLNDDRAIGEMAARFLAARGYRNLLLFRPEGGVNMAERAEGFERAGREAGCRIVRITFSFAAAPMPWNPAAFQRQVEDSIRPALSELPPDLGIFGTNDEAAWLLLRALEHWFPERLHTSAVLGVDNSQQRFHYGSQQGLSSIQPGFFEMGRAAMEWLAAHPGDRKAAPGVVRRFAPTGIVERASTAGGCCTDPLTARMVRRAWQWVQDGDRFTLADLAAEHRMSRRTLERRFETHLQRSAQETVATMRIEKACQLLRETLLPVAQISSACGFSKQESLSRSMKRTTGQTPLEYRSAAKAATASALRGSA